MKNDELKPCPFCGSTDIVMNKTDSGYYWAECDDCLCQIGGEDSYDEALTGWNTRTEPTKEQDNGIGKAPVDNIREAFNRLCPIEDIHGVIREPIFNKVFVPAIKSQQAEIERLNKEHAAEIDDYLSTNELLSKFNDKLKAELEDLRCCGNCSYSSDDQPVQSKSECKSCFRRIGFEAEISDFKDNWKLKDITK